MFQPYLIYIHYIIAFTWSLYTSRNILERVFCLCVHSFTILCHHDQIYPSFNLSLNYFVSCRYVLQLIFNVCLTIVSKTSYVLLHFFKKICYLKSKQLCHMLSLAILSHHDQISYFQIFFVFYHFIFNICLTSKFTGFYIF